MSSRASEDASAILLRPPHPLREDQGPVLGPGWWHGVVTSIFITGIVLSAVLLLDKKKDPEERRFAIAVFAVCSVPFALTMIQLVRLRRKIGKAGLFLLNDSIPLGFSGKAMYFRPLRGGAAIRQIEASVQCVEALVKGKGKSERTFNATVYNEPATCQFLLAAEDNSGEDEDGATPGMEEMQVEVSFRIPESGPPTLDGSRLSIRWRIHLRLTMDGCPNTRSSFEVTVLPVVVRR